MINKDTLKSLHIRPIAYYPIYTEITGSTTAGIALSQLMFWLSKKDKIYKTDAEIKAETYLKDNELRAAKKKIKALDFISVTLEGVPAKTYYSIDWEIYQTSLVKFTKLDELNSPNSIGEIHQTITKTTTKTTTKSKKNIQKKEKEVIPPNLNAEAYEMWCKHKGSTYTQQGKTLSINKLLQYPKDVQMQMVENSIMNNYKGLFEVTASKGNNNTGSQHKVGSVLWQMEQEAKEKKGIIDV